MNYPSYRYLGPFNAMNKGRPRNWLDRAAYRHDVAYGKQGWRSYFQFSKADQDLLDAAARPVPRPTWGQYLFDEVPRKITRAVFGFKKWVAPRMSKKRQWVPVVRGRKYSFRNYRGGVYVPDWSESEAERSRRLADESMVRVSQEEESGLAKFHDVLDEKLSVISQKSARVKELREASYDASSGAESERLGLEANALAAEVKGLQSEYDDLQGRYTEQKRVADTSLTSGLGDQSALERSEEDEKGFSAPIVWNNDPADATPLRQTRREAQFPKRPRKGSIPALERGSRRVRRRLSFS